MRYSSEKVGSVPDNRVFFCAQKYQNGKSHLLNVNENFLKVFIYHPEEDIPFWDPEPPEAWQQAYPRGHAVILEVRDMGL